MRKFKALPIIAGAAALGLLCGNHDAVATTFDITSCHIDSPGSCGTATSFGTVTLTQTGTSVDFAVSLSDSNQFVLTGSADNQYFKFNATDVTTGDITVTQNVTPHLIADTGSFNGDGTGNFTFGITCSPITANTPCATGGGAALPVGTTLDFSVANSTISDFLIDSGKGNFFVADILCGPVATSGCTGTGPVDVAVPAPIIGHGLFVLLAIGSVLGGSKLLENRKKLHLQAA